MGIVGSWTALNAFPSGLPWVRMITTSIGRWTTGASYPGPEQAFVDEGLFFYHESCANGGAGLDFTDLFYGATTSQGFLLSLPDGALQPIGMIDLASNYALAAGAPPIGPFLGTVLESRHLIYTNIYD